MDLTQRAMQSIETDDILFEILNASAELKAALSGGIYAVSYTHLRAHET